MRSRQNRVFVRRVTPIARTVDDLVGRLAITATSPERKDALRLNVFCTSKPGSERTCYSVTVSYGAGNVLFEDPCYQSQDRGDKDDRLSVNSVRSSFLTTVQSKLASRIIPVKSDVEGNNLIVWPYGRK